MRALALAFMTLVATATASAPKPGGQTPAAYQIAAAGLHGRVSTATGVAIPGVQLRLTPVDGAPSDARAATSDSAGVFGWNGLSAGHYLLSARRVGFLPINVAFDLADGVDRQVTVQLTAVQRLDTVRTQTTGLTPGRYGTSSRMDEFYRRMHEGNGKFITREQIDSMVAISSADLFRKVPGVTATFLTNGTVLVHAIGCRGTSIGVASSGDGGARNDGWGNVALYVDGVLIRGDRGLTLGLLTPSEIEAMEIYRNPTELPDEAVGNACAAVYVWTRVGADSSGHFL